MDKKKKRSFKDRRDGRYVKAPGLQTIMAYLFPKRTDSEVYLHDVVDVTELLAYLKEKNESHPEFKTTVFHASITALARMVRERPVMNRFIQGYRLYERDEISLSFVAKRRFADETEESLMVLVPKDTDTLFEISKKIAGDVKEMRKSEHATGGIDETLDKFAALPRFILIPVIRFIRILDFWGHVPKSLTEGDTNYTTILCSNLGSIGGPSVYHHLNNYGTNSIMVTFGTIHKEEIVLPNGEKTIRDVMDLGATIDERIGDGFYFVRSLKLVKHIFAHPELLDRPIGENSGFTYE